MEFKVFAKKLKNVIGGKSNTKIFTKTIFEAMMNESGPELLADTSLDTFKAYFNGNTSISKVAALILANLSDDDEFPSYLEGFGDTTAQLLADEFKNDIPDINSVNASLKITELFLEILKEAAGKEKSTPKSAYKTSHDILEEKILASGQAVADAWRKAMEALADDMEKGNTKQTEKPRLIFEHLSTDDALSLKRFREGAKPLFKYCIENDPSTGPTDLFLADNITDFISSWKFEYREIEDYAFRTLVKDTMDILSEYTYYLSDQFLRLIPERNILWFRNESWEEGEQLRKVLQPESYRLRCEIRNLYLRLYPLPEEDNKSENTTIIQQQTNVVQNGDSNINLTNNGTINIKL